MEVTAPLFRLIAAVCTASPQFLWTAGEASLQVVPDRQQHFERDALTLSCEGLDGPTRWKVLRKVKGRVGPCGSTWESATGTCKIVNVYKVDSGEYWCERAERKSSSVNITVTGGPVILESPVAPVMEGDDVMLRCAQRTNSSNYLTASFYKNHFLLEESPTGNVTIHRVSRSHQGSYKCSIAGVGESEQSWLTVTATLEDPPSSPPLHLLLTIGVSVVLIALLLWLAVHQHKINETTRASPSSPQSCSSPGAAEQHQPPPVNTTLSSGPVAER
ncbi:hypothetical protein INR49_001239 [Caranx melampygus]|nr:hypothetical protein INR49_001239 [Caranx melampygus]